MHSSMGRDYASPISGFHVGTAGTSGFIAMWISAARTRFDVTGVNGCSHQGCPLSQRVHPRRTEGKRDSSTHRPRRPRLWEIAVSMTRSNAFGTARTSRAKPTQCLIPARPRKGAKGEDLGGVEECQLSVTFGLYPGFVVQIVRNAFRSSMKSTAETRVPSEAAISRAGLLRWRRSASPVASPSIRPCFVDEHNDKWRPC